MPNRFWLDLCLVLCCGSAIGSEQYSRLRLQLLLAAGDDTLTSGCFAAVFVLPATSDQLGHRRPSWMNSSVTMPTLAGDWKESMALARAALPGPLSLHRPRQIATRRMQIATRPGRCYLPCRRNARPVRKPPIPMSSIAGTATLWMQRALPSGQRASRSLVGSACQRRLPTTSAHHLPPPGSAGTPSLLLGARRSAPLPKR